MRPDGRRFARTLPFARNRHIIERLGRIGAAGELVEHAIDLDATGVERQLALDLRRGELAGDLQLGVDVRTAEVVAQDAELAPVHLERDRAQRGAAQAELAGDLERILVLVEHAQAVDDEAPGLEAQAGGQARVVSAGAHHSEGAVAERDAALKERRVRRAAHVQIDLRRAGQRW